MPYPKSYEALLVQSLAWLISRELPAADAGKVLTRILQGLILKVN